MADANQSRWPDKFRVIRGATVAEVNQKVALQLRAWDEQWTRVQAARARRAEREKWAWDNYERKRLAEDQTRLAEKVMAALDGLLREAVARDHRVDWSSLKDHAKYPVPKPAQPHSKPIPPEPLRTEYAPGLNWFLRLIPLIRDGRIADAEKRFQAAHSSWEATKLQLQDENRRQGEEYECQVADWESKKAGWLRDQQERNVKVDQRQAAHISKDPYSVTEYCEMVLNASEYPDGFPSSFELDYIADTRMVVIDYSLPPPEALPKFKAYKYVAARDEIHPVPVSEAWSSKTYELVLYQIALRSLFELFQSDVVDALHAAVFNGWVNSIDKASGKPVNACVLTIQAGKSELLDMNLTQVDPKACFKKLKGISAAKLTALAPVRPILQLNRDDKRFIQPYAVMGVLDGAANLAAMDWEDFEHLIREVFEKEFSGEGCEVKITQASRDRGVDAIVFDPDPIKGGKIVIQAKRYTNTVGVSAVRDLFGTIHNEGANKGILVTTADYGPDAYEFARGKPITLLNGNELLYLLQKHGHKARIDLAEARLLGAEQERV